HRRVELEPRQPASVSKIVDGQLWTGSDPDLQPEKRAVAELERERRPGGRGVLGDRHGARRLRRDRGRRRSAPGSAAAARDERVDRDTDHERRGRGDQHPVDPAPPHVQRVRPRRARTIPRMESLYRPEGVEERWQRTWEEEGLYRAGAGQRRDDSYVIA